MRYLVLPNPTVARNRSAQIATFLGCGLQVADITRFWFAVLANTAGAEGALEVAAPQEFRLSASEINSLIEKASLPPGWFPEETTVGGEA